jgi:hypothetical protein
VCSSDLRRRICQADPAGDLPERVVGDPEVAVMRERFAHSDTR